MMASLVRCLFAVSTFGVVAVTPVRARVAYQLIVYGDNVPDSVLDKVAKNGLFLLSKVLSSLPGYQAVGPGEYESCPNRALHEHGEELTLPGLRGGSPRLLPNEPGGEDAVLERGLQSSSQCPASCKYKASSTCRSIGCCATCGRRRNLVEALTCRQALLLEAVLDQTLALNCLGRLGTCTLKSKILKIGSDGSAEPIC